LVAANPPPVWLSGQKHSANEVYLGIVSFVVCAEN